jgi:hypothetical protein
MKRTMVALALAVTCGASAAGAQVPVADFYSTTSLLNGAPLPAGTTIEAYDIDGIRCGYAQANNAGEFLIHVYGNDPMTPAIDEGAREGEALVWKVAGADILPQDAKWLANLVGLFADLRWENGAAKQIQLEAHTTDTYESSWTELKSRYRP